MTFSLDVVVTGGVSDERPREVNLLGNIGRLFLALIGVCGLLKRTVNTLSYESG